MSDHPQELETNDVTRAGRARRVAPESWSAAREPQSFERDLTRALDPRMRLPKLLDVERDLAQVLAKQSIAVVGAGSVGMRIIDALARIGIGELRIVDPRATKRESLLTHPIQPEDVGASKAGLAARRARAVAPRTRVYQFEGPFEWLGHDGLLGCSLVVLATDSLAAEVSVTQACARLGLPLVQASVWGPGLTAQVRSLAGAEQGQGEGEEQSPCLMCGFSAPELEALDRGTRFSCEGLGQGWGEGKGDGGGGEGAVPEPASSPTVSPPHLCGLAADLAVGEILRRLMDLGGGGSKSEMLDFCGYHAGTHRSPLVRNPDCPIDHTPWRIRSVATRLEGFCLREVAHVTGHGDDDLDALSFEVEGHRFAALVVCDCDRHPRLGGFVCDHETLGGCDTCGSKSLTPHPLHTFRQVPGRAIEAYFDETLTALGVEATRSVVVRGPRGTTLVRTTAGLHEGAAAIDPTFNPNEEGTQA